MSIFLSSLLIGVVLLFRYIFRGKVRAGAIYALWGLVALRLLIPVQIFSMPSALQSFFPVESKSENTEQASGEEDIVQYRYEPAEVSQSIAIEEGALDQESLSRYNYESVKEDRTGEAGEDIASLEEKGIPGTDLNGEDQGTDKEVVGRPGTSNIRKWIFMIWGTVAIILFIIILCSNVFLFFRLRKNRVAIKSDKRPFIYRTDCFNVPCLYGLFRPAIYMNPEVAESTPEEQEYIILHEKMHYRHLDHIWAAVRVFIVCVYWFNPLVWAGAKFSRQDAEYAADEAVTRNLGEEERIQYGKTILNTLRSGRRKGGLLSVASTAGSSKREMEKRLIKIAEKRKTSAVALVVLTVVALGLTACSFAGKQGGTEGDRTQENPVEENRTETASGSAVKGTDQAEEKEILVERPLEDAICDAIKDDFSGKMMLSSTGQYVKVMYKNVVESHTILAKKETRDTVTVYLMMQTGCYGVGSTEQGRNKCYYGLQGGESGFRAITFKKKEEENETVYQMTKYWQPPDGEKYDSAVRKKFPEDVLDEELDQKRYLNHLNAECHQKALEYLKKKESTSTKQNAKAIRKINGEVDKINIFTSDGVVDHFHVNEDPDFVKKLVDAYNQIELVPVTNIEENALNVEQSITIDFYIKNKEVPVQIIFDADRVCWILGHPCTLIMNDTVFDYNEIRDFVKKQGRKSEQVSSPFGTGIIDIADYGNDMQIMVNLLEEESIIAKFIKRRAKIMSVKNGVSFYDEYHSEILQIEQLKKQYLLAKDLGIAATEEEAQEGVWDMLSGEMWEGTQLKEYCKSRNIERKQYREYLKKWYMVSNFNYDEYMRIHNISEEELADRMKEDLENYTIRVIE